ncbi:diguanylate cyclase/phosphodiesterase (GGDEF & EAL domain) with PAS/PAC sensor(s) [Rhodopirellula islandica]|uniref:Diguanylate cyclase/phosphodiesterase (GGDEF & EAL domain) with PAS/PAC sensor(S) n=1 Tax=Rhodopirellula islandica TaxID=595434 RepID=A0A0J1B8Q4_RHOIS|nr:AraC family transcriptional regulator [Rhodopirellula islandica]KLU02836.1 diguanylate cyclase/phosphodiesterase (GGDEF & EAL domain) with PAS/PAC sensor(s) [Rhodopirellula islandica]
MAKPTPDVTDWRNEVFGSIVNPLACLELFDYLPQVYMYVKAADGRYLRANRVVCRVVGVNDESAIIGKTDFDFFPPAIATQYVEEDRRVVASGATLTDQVWLVPDSRGVPQIYSCNKIPLLDQAGDVVALAGVKRPYHDSEAPESGHLRLLKVVQFVTQHYGDEISVSDLAREANLSQSQLHREFTRLFGITPNHYIREVRVGVARHLLETTQEAVGVIAASTGFYDQSHLTRQFKSSTGITPTEYRRMYSPLE